MSEFLVVVKKTVVDQAFEPAIPEVIEDLTAVPPIAGSPAVPEVPLITHEEVDKVYVETDAGTVARVLAEGNHPLMEFYQIQFNGVSLQATLHPVTLKAGPRTIAPAREVAEIQANGQDAGSAVVEA